MIREAIHGKVELKREGLDVLWRENTPVVNVSRLSQSTAYCGAFKAARVAKFQKSLDNLYPAYTL